MGVSFLKKIGIFLPPYKYIMTSTRTKATVIADWPLHSSHIATPLTFKKPVH